jgi:hypothetical protein
MSGETKVKRPLPARKRRTKSERKMTDKESSALLESASQGLAMVKGSRLGGRRVSVRSRLRQPGSARRKKMQGEVVRADGEDALPLRVSFIA